MRLGSDSGASGSDDDSGVVGVVVGAGRDVDVDVAGVESIESADTCGKEVGAGTTASFSTSDRSSVGRGVSTTHRWEPPGSASTTTETDRSPACVGTLTRALCVPAAPVTGVLTVGPVMTTGVRGRAATMVPAGVSSV